jgi:NADH dehydrogenase
MQVIIYRNGEVITQSGKAKEGMWILESKTISNDKEPIMGWTSNSDTQSQIKLEFQSLESAIDYAKKHQLEFIVEDEIINKPVIRSYSDNFK